MIRFASLLGLLAAFGCSSTAKQRPVAATPVAVAASVQVRTEVAAPPVATPAARDDAAGDATEEALADAEAMGTLEEAQVKGEGITVDVSWWTMTGSTHVANALTITTPRGKLELASPTPDDADDEGGETLPLIEEIYSVGKDRWVLLGWSSYGEGMQTEHAWLVEGSAAPRVVDKLEWTTDRTHAGLALIPGKQKLRIGIPLPKVTARDEDGDRGLHAESDWQLAHGAKTWSLAQVSKLRASNANLMTVQPYTPPFNASASEQRWSGRFVWFAVEKGFVRR